MKEDISLYSQEMKEYCHRNFSLVWSLLHSKGEALTPISIEISLSKAFAKYENTNMQGRKEDIKLYSREMKEFWRWNVPVSG